MADGPRRFAPRLNGRFRSQLLRFAPAALVDSKEFLSVAAALEKEKLPAQERLLDIARLVTDYEMVDPDHIRAEAANRDHAAKILRDAAQILEAKYPGVAMHVARKRGLISGWPHNLKLMARIIERDRGAITSEYVGTRGGASKPDGARRAAVIRKINELLPQEFRERQHCAPIQRRDDDRGSGQAGYAVIATFLTIAGHDTSPQLVRSTILGGHT